MRARNRISSVLLITSTLGVCWYGMQAIHESGHVLAAVATGGRVDRVVLHPLTISRTDLSRNPHPLVVVWTGPLLGAAALLMLWLAARRWLPRVAWLPRFFAGFCLIANGLYIAAGALRPVGDAEVMVRLAVPPWLMASFGLVCVPAGLWLWHGTGRRLGLTPPVNHRRTIVMTATFLLLTILLLLSPR